MAVAGRRSARSSEEEVPPRTATVTPAHDLDWGRSGAVSGWLGQLGPAEWWDAREDGTPAHVPVSGVEDAGPRRTAETRIQDGESQRGGTGGSASEGSGGDAPGIPAKALASRPREADGLSAREEGKPSRDLLDYALPMNRFRRGSV